MTINVKKMMTKNSDGSHDQYYPETHARAIVDLDKFVNLDIDTGVISVNGKRGLVVLTAADVGIYKATEDSTGLLTPELYQKFMNSGSSENSITITPVSENIYQMYKDSIPFYPKTKAEAIEGLAELLTETGIKGEKGDTGPQGPAGAAENLQEATEEANGLMSSDDKKIVNYFKNIKFQKVGEV